MRRKFFFLMGFDIETRPCYPNCTNTHSTVGTVRRNVMKVIKKVVAALMVLGALAALTVGVVLKPGRKGDET